MIDLIVNSILTHVTGALSWYTAYPYLLQSPFTSFSYHTWGACDFLRGSHFNVICQHRHRRGRPVDIEYFYVEFVGDWDDCRAFEAQGHFTQFQRCG